jgi:hypothetical protein
MSWSDDGLTAAPLTTSRSRYATLAPSSEPSEFRSSKIIVSGGWEVGLVRSDHDEFHGGKLFLGLSHSTQPCLFVRQSRRENQSFVQPRFHTISPRYGFSR